jgi:hypothetical protein
MKLPSSLQCSLAHVTAQKKVGFAVNHPDWMASLNELVE